MSTQGTSYTDSNIPPTRKATTDGRSPMDVAEGTASDLKVRMRQMVESGKTQVTSWRDGVQDGIREKPIQSILIAAAVGAVLGVLLGRRSR